MSVQFVYFPGPPARPARRPCPLGRGAVFIAPEHRLRVRVGEEPVLLHEPGHAVGLAHFDGPTVMNPLDRGYPTFRPGDVAAWPVSTVRPRAGETRLADRNRSPLGILGAYGRKRP
jgi:hypothetical protein